MGNRLGMLDRFLDRLALTKTERRIILFLCTTFSLGLAAKFYLQAYGGSAPFDYRASDSAFASLSERMLSDDSSEFRNAETTGRLNLNAANKAQLMALPGVGEVTAEQILIYREEHDGFSMLEDLMRVRGISKKKFDKLKPLLTLH